MISVFMMVVVYAQCRYAGCRYAESRYAECRYAGCHDAECCGAATVVVLTMVYLDHQSGVMTLSIMTFSITTLSILTFNIMTLNIIIINWDTQHKADCCYTVILFMLSVAKHIFYAECLYAESRGATTEGILWNQSINFSFKLIYTTNLRARFCIKLMRFWKQEYFCHF